MEQNKDTRKNLRIDAELHQKIKILSAQLGLSMVGLIASLVDKKTEEFEEEKTKKEDD